MTESTAYLSPNGLSTVTGEGPATRLLVGTVEGVCTFQRGAPGAPWSVAGRSLAERHVGALLFEPRSGKLFAGAHDDGGLWVSDDGTGAAWRQVTKGLDRPHIYSLAARPRGDSVRLYLGTEPAAIYFSDDLGESWTELPALRHVPGTEKWTFPPPPHIAHVKSIVFHPGRPTTMYALVEQGALLKSTDEGRSWVELDEYSKPDDVVYRDAHRLLIVPSSPDTFYLATGDGLYRSDDAGETWTRLTSRTDRVGYPDCLFVDPHDDGVLYMAGGGRNPSTWRKTGVSNAAVLQSVDGGRTWRELDNGLPHPVVGSFEAMGQYGWPGGMMLIIATATGEVYTSEDGGESWVRIAQDMPPVSKAGHYTAFVARGGARAEGAGAGR